MTQNTAAVIQAITSIVNLIFVGGIFIFERRTSKKNVNDEKKEFWYRQTLLSRGLDLTGECFDTMEQLLRSSEEFINECTPENEKKIKEIMIENKLPISQRITYPILIDSNNNIIWIPGIKKSKFCSKKNEKYDIIIECKEREENYE